MAAQSSSAHVGFTAAVLILCTFALLSSYAQADCGGYTASCSSCDVTSAGELKCVCKNDRGGISFASLDLNRHIGNNNGNLVDGAGFVGSCRYVKYVWVWESNYAGVHGECKKGSGGYGGVTHFNLGRRVANYGGNLVFNNCRRRSLLQIVDADASINAGRKMLRM